MAKLIELDWPTFGPAPEPVSITADHLTARLARVRQAMANADLTHLVLYADREHYANLVWLTNFDPRFEEAILLVGLTGKPLLLVGNECVSYLPISPLYREGLLDAERYQPLSLPDQPRDGSRQLQEILAGFGIGAAARVGCAGWKEYGDPAHLDAPAYLVDLLRRLAGFSGVTNASGLLIRLRQICTAEEIAYFEFTNWKASEAMRRLQFAIREGITDYELIAAAGYDGLPLSCHITCKTGPNRISLASASGERFARGYPWSANIAYWGANICRAGWVAESAQDLPAAAQDYVDNFAGPYMEAMAEWLRTLSIGATGDQLHQAVHRRLPFAKYGIFLNAGHLIHLEEWLSAPVYAGSTEVVASGMVWQTDVIPSSKQYFSSRMEDGLAIAGPELRSLLQQQYPECWTRIQARRQFAEQVLGFSLHPEQLPLSNTFGIVAPFALRPNLVFSVG